MTTTQFSLLEKRILFRDNMPIYRVLDDRYADPIYQKVVEIAAARGPDIAMLMLKGMVDSLAGKITSVNDLDRMMLDVEQKSEHRAQTLGQKHTCTGCKRKFYDMNKQLSCPICKTSVPTTVSSDKQ